MALSIWTARLSSKDPDAFDVTRKTGNVVFAPTWRILSPMLKIRREGRRATDEEWRAYARNYFEEMRSSLKSHPEAWKALRARERVVLTCYCTDPPRCHRTLLGKFLEKLGASFHGELDDRRVTQTQAELFKLAMTLDEDD